MAIRVLKDNRVCTEVHLGSYFFLCSGFARALYTTPDYLLGFEEKRDSFEKEVLEILQEIKDDTVRKMLLKQMRALL